MAGSTTLDHTETQARRLLQLEQANLELRQFANRCAHDLQEPLRIVGSYLMLLERKSGGALPEESLHYLRTAVEGAGRMQALISELLTWCRILEKPCELGPTPLEPALRRALTELSPQIAATGARITHDPLPEAHGCAKHLPLLFRHLVDNALKFRREAPPEVEIRATTEAGRVHVAVKDEGIGIEPEYLERIFLPFERLHGAGKYPGAGLGLAICRRIVERCGGTIHAESTPNEGSVFHVTLPARGPEIETD
ncbi:MAG: ATP-binding protein [Bryobacter sp.]|jgi:hypothetical protein|nr:ATP-binding protein [Bryobacter sp.]